MSDRKKGGRPPKAAEERRTKTISIQLTGMEYRRVINEAKSAGMKPSIYLRQKAFLGRVQIVPEVNRKTWAELGRVGGLLKIFLNQVRNNEVYFHGEKGEAWTVELVNILKQIRSEILGR